MKNNNKYLLQYECLSLKYNQVFFFTGEGVKGKNHKFPNLIFEFLHRGKSSSNVPKLRSND